MADRTAVTRLAWSSVGLFALAALLGAGFAGWLDRGAAMFLAMAETGLSWCF